MFRPLLAALALATPSLAFAQCVVTNTDLVGTGALFTCLFQANQDPDLTEIVFDLPPGVDPVWPPYTFELDIDTPIVLDGLSQPGATWGDEGDGLLITLTGGAALGSLDTILNFLPGSEGSEVRGIRFDSQHSNAIRALDPGGIDGLTVRDNRFEGGETFHLWLENVDWLDIRHNAFLRPTGVNVHVETGRYVEFADNVVHGGAVDLNDMFVV